MVLLNLFTAGVTLASPEAQLPGCEAYCKREVDELELQGGRVYLHLETRRNEPPRP